MDSLWVSDMNVSWVRTIWRVSLFLQVMVWIHGGALIGGSASEFDGSKLVASEDVIVVTIQYRLGVLGFFR